MTFLPPDDLSCRDVKRGQRFLSGEHLLPLERIEDRFGQDKKSFVEYDLMSGAEISRLGDAAASLYQLSRVPVTVILKHEDEEHPAWATFYVDSMIDLHLSLTDIVIAAMMSTSVIG